MWERERWEGERVEEEEDGEKADGSWCVGFSVRSMSRCWEELGWLVRGGGFGERGIGWSGGWRDGPRGRRLYAAFLLVLRGGGGKR